MKRAVNQPLSELTVYAGIFLKTWAVPDAGTTLPQHSHEFPHLSLIVSGSVRVWCGEGLVGEFTAPAAVKIAAHEKHTFVTMTDAVVIACVHALDEGADEASLIHEEHQLEMEG